MYNTGFHENYMIIFFNIEFELISVLDNYENIQKNEPKNFILQESTYTNPTLSYLAMS